MIYVTCPHCQTMYPANLLYTEPSDGPEAGKTYTIRCNTCSYQFNVQFRTRRRFLRPPIIEAQYS